MDSTYITQNFPKLYKIDRFVTMFFLLENNRPNFLKSLTVGMPKLLLTSFWATIEQRDNEEIAEYLNAYLKPDDYKLFSTQVFSYVPTATNWTSDQAIKEYFGINETTQKSTTFQDVSDWFSGFVGGSEQSKTQTTSSTTSNPSTIISILAILGLIFGLIFYFKK